MHNKGRFPNVFSGASRRPDGAALAMVLMLVFMFVATQSVQGQTQGAPVSQDVMQGHLFKTVAPVYPPLARAARVQGTVVLAVLIGKDGSIESLTLVSGHPMLVPAAIDAVKQWKYKPYLLNGKAVKAETEVSVNFELSGGVTQSKEIKPAETIAAGRSDPTITALEIVSTNPSGAEVEVKISVLDEAGDLGPVPTVRWMLKCGGNGIFGAKHLGSFAGTGQKNSVIETSLSQAGGYASGRCDFAVSVEDSKGNKSAEVRRQVEFK